MLGADLCDGGAAGGVSETALNWLVARIGLGGGGRSSSSSPASVPNDGLAGPAFGVRGGGGGAGRGGAGFWLFEPDPPLGGAGGRTDIVTSTAAVLLRI